MVRTKPIFFLLLLKKRSLTELRTSDWETEDTEAANGGEGTKNLWEESWDDDDTSDDFSTQLRYVTLANDLRYEALLTSIQGGVEEGRSIEEAMSGTVAALTEQHKHRYEGVDKSRSLVGL